MDRWTDPYKCLMFLEPRPRMQVPRVPLIQTPLLPDPAHLGIQVEEAVVLEAQPEHVPRLDTLLHEAPRRVQPPGPQRRQRLGQG